MPRGAIVVPRDELLDDMEDNSGLDHDKPRGLLDRHKTNEARENNAGGETGAGGEGDNNRDSVAQNPAPPCPNAIAGTTQAGGNIRETVKQMIAHRKFDDNAQQDLHCYAKASMPERDIMDFLLNLEVQQETQKVANTISSSTIHPELKLDRRKFGEPEMDLGLLVAHATKGTTIKITAQHYGQFAWLYWCMEKYKEAGDSKLNFWDFVDQALKDLCSEITTSQKSINHFFKKAIKKDEIKWSKVVGKLHDDSQLEEWQCTAHREGSLLSSK
ncbi:hypothetical protein FRC09_002670 [Ceratobasidium sp. 395]|nr:hypothetical protein FRC09_002670 [Ceratobasidium sp. 395]